MPCVEQSRACKAGVAKQERNVLDAQASSRTCKARGLSRRPSASIARGALTAVASEGLSVSSHWGARGAAKRLSKWARARPLPWLGSPVFLQLAGASDGQSSSERRSYFSPV
eukprot:6514465-Pyramimonas_sp.AAC.1